MESPRPTRPRMDRPKSANDANALMPPHSPTKGILLTPGTAAAKKKNVTFGRHVVDNQEKRPVKSGLPDDCPGKFPSPWTKGADVENDGPLEKGRGRNKLTEALEQARDESRLRRGKPERDDEGVGKTRVPADENECCEYWRHEYEAYRTNTQREVKKLVKKYKAAKDYAQSKDDEASDLRLHLQEAETKADALEEAVNLLTAQIKEMAERLRAQPQAEPAKEKEASVMTTKQNAERERPRDLLALLERRGSQARTVSTTTVRTDENDQLQRPSEPKLATSGRRALEKESLQKSCEFISAVATRRQDPAKTGQMSDALVPAKEATSAVSAAAGRTPAGIAARWAAAKEAPQRSSETAHLAAHRRDAELAGTRQQPIEPPAKPTADRSTALSTQAGSKAPTSSTTSALIPQTQTIALEPPPGDLLAPSDPAIYSPPPNSTHNNPPPPPPPPHQATVEDEDVPASTPPPQPPRHASSTLTPGRTKTHWQDSGLGEGTGGTLKPLSANARSGTRNGGDGGAVTGEAVEEQSKPVTITAKNVGRRDGTTREPPDAARLEAAKARLRERGREVS